MNGKALEAFDELFGPYSLTQKQRDELKAIVRNALSAPPFEEIVFFIKSMQANNTKELNIKLADGIPFDVAPYYERDKMFYAILRALEEMADVDTSEIATHGKPKTDSDWCLTALREKGNGKWLRN